MTYWADANIFFIIHLYSYQYSQSLNLCPFMEIDYMAEVKFKSPYVGNSSGKLLEGFEQGMT